MQQSREQYKVTSFYYFHDSVYQVKKKQVSFMITPLKPLEKILGV